MASDHGPPRARRAGRTPSRSEDPLTPTAPRVLVVDDSPELRRFMVLVLERAGMAAEPAADGEEAMERAVETPPDVVVTDYRLPGIDGLETCRRLRALCGARAVLVSGGSITPEMAARVDAVLEKPFSAADLVERVRALTPRAPREAG